MKDDFTTAMDSKVKIIIDEDHSKTPNWKELLSDTFADNFNYNKVSQTYCKLLQFKRPIAVLFFDDYNKILAPIKSFNIIEVSGLLKTKVEIHYTLFLGKSGAVLVLSDFEELDAKNDDVRVIYEIARRIVIGKSKVNIGLLIRPANIFQKCLTFLRFRAILNASKNETAEN